MKHISNFATFTLLLVSPSFAMAASNQMKNNAPVISIQQEGEAQAAEESDDFVYGNSANSQTAPKKKAKAETSQAASSVNLDASNAQVEETEYVYEAKPAKKPTETNELTPAIDPNPGVTVGSNGQGITQGNNQGTTQGSSGSVQGNSLGSTNTGYSAHYRFPISEISIGNRGNEGEPTNTNRVPSSAEPKFEAILASYGLYSPVILTNPANGKKKLFVGGFASENDPMAYLRALDNGADPTQIWGPDKIYQGDLTDNPDTNARNLKPALVMKGYHVNDPTFIHPPSTGGVNRNGWIYMYFTMLDNRLAENCRKSKRPLVECPELFAGHDIGMASSVDGGVTWEFRGIVMKATASGDGAGAWMPTATLVGNEIHVYYNTGKAEYSTPNLFRQKYNANGHQKIGSPEQVKVSDFVAGQQLHNIEVMQYENNGTKILLTGNNGSWTALPLYESADGLNFQRIKRNIAKDEDSQIITPYIETAYMNGLDCPMVVGSGCKPSKGNLRLRFYYVKHRADGFWGTHRMEYDLSPEEILGRPYEN